MILAKININCRLLLNDDNIVWFLVKAGGAVVWLHLLCHFFPFILRVSSISPAVCVLITLGTYYAISQAVHGGLSTSS